MDVTTRAGEAMVNIYRLVFNNVELPPDDEGKIRTTRDYARHVTGLEKPEIWLEPHQTDPHCRLTISIPADQEETVERMQAAGLRPDFQEPAAPQVGDGSFTMPLSFQVRNFGRPLDPRMVENNPERMMLIAGAVEGLPEGAGNILNWTHLERDDETQALTVHWSLEG